MGASLLALAKYIHITFHVFCTVSINLRGRPLKGKGKGIPGAREGRKARKGWGGKRRQGR